MSQIRLAISTCPNDTFAFHGLINREVDWRGLEFSVQLLDIQQLNEGLFQNQFDVAKASFHAAILLSQNYLVLPSGSALGFGVGPLLLASRPDTVPDSETLTLCPGEHTTAHLLFQLFYGGKGGRVEQCLFSDIMPRLKKQEADFGVCIHEGRFTWEAEGVACVEDLGTRWEQETQAPLPLGGILARKSLPVETLNTVQQVIRDSIEYGLGNRELTLPTMKRFAQEFEDDVLYQHVDLYVNDWTVELGDVGHHALGVMAEKAFHSGVTANRDALEILTCD